MWPARPACRADDTLRQRTANKRISYLAVNQTVIKSPCSWSPQKSRDHEQSNFVFHCISATYKNDVFAVRNGRTSLHIDSGRSTVILPCHSERSEESGAGTRGRESLGCSRSFADAQDDTVTLRMTERHSGQMCDFILQPRPGEGVTILNKSLFLHKCHKTSGIWESYTL